MIATICIRTLDSIWNATVVHKFCSKHLDIQKASLAATGILEVFATNVVLFMIDSLWPPISTSSYTTTYTKAIYSITHDMSPYTVRTRLITTVP